MSYNDVSIDNDSIFPSPTTLHSDWTLQRVDSRAETISINCHRAIREVTLAFLKLSDCTALCGTGEDMERTKSFDNLF